ncbi:MAG: glycosyltransferase family 2 protein [Chloroflexi bacterium]|nr:MAG: glycosyltransferase family 2 protein [Chloroflexota bacterium]
MFEGVLVMDVLSVAVVVLNWNGRFLLPDCLNALKKQDYPDYQIIVVDNASTDDSVTYLQAYHPDVTLIQSEQNLGYAGGNNIALRHLDTDIAILLNPDVIVDPDWLREITAVFRTDPQIGIVGCKLYYPGRELVQHAGGKITWPLALPGHLGGKQPDTGQYDILQDVDYVIGAAIAIRRNVLQTVGLLDDAFFLFYEDVDWCFRARGAGYRVVYAPRATAVHIESVTTRPKSPAYRYRFHTSRWRFLLKHYPPAKILTETVPAEIQWIPQHDNIGQMALAHAYLQAIRQLPTFAHIPTSTQEQIWLALQQLREHAFGSRSLAELMRQIEGETEGQKRPFRARHSLFAPLILPIRRLWHYMTAPYLLAIHQQQSQFNRQIAHTVHTVFQRLQRQDRQQTQYLFELAQTRQQLKKIHQRLTNLEKQLADWEQTD